MHEKPLKPIIETDVEDEADRPNLDESRPGSSDDRSPDNRSVLRKLAIPALFLIVAVAGFASSADWFDFLNLETAERPLENIDDQFDVPTNPETPQTPSTEVESPVKNDIPRLSPILPQQSEQILAECRRVIQHLNTNYSDSLEAKEMEARFEFDFGDIKKAQRNWSQILEVNPGFVYALRGLGDVATKEGELKDAVRYFRKAVLAEPNNLSRQLTLGSAMMQAGQLDEAKQVLESLLKLDTQNGLGHAELGRVLLQLNELESAKEQFELSLAVNPDVAETHLGLATAYVRLGNREKAKEHQAEQNRLRELAKSESESGRRDYDDVEALQIDIGTFYVDISRIYLAAANPQAAELLLLRASRMNPENIDCRQALAFMAAQQGKSFEAIRWMSEITDLQPSEFAYAEEVARLYMDSQQIDEAEEVLSNFVEANPSNFLALRSFARFQLEARGSAEGSLEYTLRAVELDPTANAYAGLAAAYERTSDLGEAVTAMEKAVELAPDNTVFSQTLALLKEKRDTTVSIPK